MKAKPTAAPKAPYVIAVICSLAVILIAYAFFFVPKLNQTASLDNDVIAAEADNANLQAKDTILKGKIDHLPEATAQVAAFNKSFPSDASQQDLISSILDAAEAAGVKVTGVNPAAPAPVAGADQPAAPAPAAAPASAGTDPGATAETPAAQTSAVSDFSKVLAAVPLTINAAGEPDALVAFMKKLESLKRPLTVTEVTLVRSSDGSGLLTLTAQSFLSAPLPAPAKSPAPAASAAAETPDASAEGTK